LKTSFARKSYLYFPSLPPFFFHLDLPLFSFVSPVFLPVRSPAKACPNFSFSPSNRLFPPFPSLDLVFYFLLGLLKGSLIPFLIVSGWLEGLDLRSCTLSPSCVPSLPAIAICLCVAAVADDLGPKYEVVLSYLFFSVSTSLLPPSSCMTFFLKSRTPAAPKR